MLGPGSCSGLRASTTCSGLSDSAAAEGLLWHYLQRARWRGVSLATLALFSCGMKWRSW